MTTGRCFGNQRGVTLLMVLVMVVVLGLAAGMAGNTWRAIMQREREEELLWRGDQYRRAIRSYFELNQGGIQRYPARLEDLLRDPRSLQVLRHLRRLYPEPVTGGEWVIVKDPAGGIKGVRSASSDEPFKKDDFPEEYEDFVDRAKYSEWEFTHTPEKKSAKDTGAAATTTPGTLPVNQ